jgi:two-component system, LytTR family, response regulator
MKSTTPTVLVAAETPTDGMRISQSIAHDEDLQLLGQWNGHEDLNTLCATLRPDILILGVDLPNICGFDLLDGISGSQRPTVIFVSGASTHAVKAFRYHPLDFLISPVDEIRMKESISRAKQVLLQSMDSSVIDEIQMRTTAPDGEGGVPRRVMVKSAGRIFLLRPEDIDWVAAERDYVCIHNAGKKHLIREKISEMERNLPGDRFLRIHRSTIVNVERIRELHPMCYGDYAVVLNDGTRLILSRSYRGRVFSRLTTAA